MTRNPPRLMELQEQFEQRIGPYWLGTVGDEHHFYGYHLGGFEVGPQDYSVILPRDKNGVRGHGGYWASAVDIGMGWDASRSWLKWLVNEVNRRKFEDIREIIGSTDGDITYLWDAPSRHVHRHAGVPHIKHTHISFYRDSISRSHSYLFDTWSASGRILPQPSRKAPRPTPGTTPVVVEPSTPDRPVPEGSVFGPQSLILAAGIGSLAWIIKRRMERAREDTQQDS